MRVKRSVWHALIVALSVCGLALPAAAPAFASATSDHSQVSARGKTGLTSTGRSARFTQSRPSTGLLSPTMNSTSNAGDPRDGAAIAAAERAARKSGRPVTISALTTATSVTLAEPDGKLVMSENVLPVRVRSGSSWVPVDTTLRRDADGEVSPGALPGDSVSFSDGGASPLVRMNVAGTWMELWWPGRLPVPVISGSSAIYRNVLLGVNLAMTADSAAAGGFSEVLEVETPAAARDPQLSRLALRVTSHGTEKMSVTGDGGLQAVARAAGGYYSAPAPVMWDSSYLAAGGTRTAATSRMSAARDTGGFLAGSGVGVTSSVVGPAAGAREARVSASVDDAGTALELTPDSRMLRSPSTAFPVFIDPSYTFTYQTLDGDKQDFAPVQSEDDSEYDCANQPDYNDTTDFPVTPVGYDNWEEGACSNADIDYSYFQLAVPSGIWYGHINSATVSGSVAYSSECGTTAAVELSWTGGINSGTDWSNQPDDLGDEDSENFGTNSDSCGGVYDYSATVTKGFPVTSLLQRAANEHWKTFTFRLWEPGVTDSSSDEYYNDDYHRQFAENPQLQVTFNQTPNKPSGLTISDGGAGASCTGTPYPWVGTLTTNLTMSAVVTDRDSAFQMEGIFFYSDNGGSSWTQVNTAGDSAYATSGNPVTGEIPEAAINDAADGTEFEWYAEAYDGDTDGSGYSDDSATCYFMVEGNDGVAPSAPTVSSPTAGSNCPSSGIQAGCSVTFTITSNNASDDPATEFVWGLDQNPSDSSPPSSQVVDLASGETSTTVTVTAVPGPGPHAFYAYTKDAAGNDSNVIGTNDPSTFTASEDTWSQTYASFADALGAKEPFDNEMVSTSSTESGDGDADGANDSLSESELAAAGWKGNGQITVDGATFALPDFGTGVPDNLLAANETIDLPSDSEGTSLVFLATGVNADAASPDAADLPATSLQTAPSTPYVPEGTSLAGSECDAYQSSIIDPTTGLPYCTVPEGAITYGNGSTENYYLTVPDWISGPNGPAVIETLDRDTSTGTQNDLPNIYAFTVPLNPGEDVSSVTLPDIGTVLWAGGHGFAAVHILGIAVANTTTATPGVPGSALATGQTWTGAWAGPSETAVAQDDQGTATTYTDETFRISTQASVSGSSVRLRLTDDLGWLAYDATGPALDIGHVTVAEESGSGAGVVSGTVQTATFYDPTTETDTDSVIIPQGSDVYSVPIPFTVTAGEWLSVSIYLSNSVSYLVQHTYCSSCQEWVTDPGDGDQTTSTSATPYEAADSLNGYFSDILSGVDVETAGLPTTVVLGDNVFNGAYMGLTGTGLTQVAGELAAAEDDQSGGPSTGVVSEGIDSNAIMNDYNDSYDIGGPSALSRLAADVLAEPNVGTVVVDEGLEDLIMGTQGEVALAADGYAPLATQLQAWGINSVWATLTPCYGYVGGATEGGEPCTSATPVDSYRMAANTFLQGQYSHQYPCLIAPCTYVDDFSTAVGVTAVAGTTTVELQLADNAGDFINLTQDGYDAVADTVLPSQIALSASPPDY
jgi:hypothetical protein